MHRRTVVLAFPALLALAGAARAQGYPNKPIRYIVPVAAGGGSDLVGRTVTERWSKVLGQPFVVDNQSGAALERRFHSLSDANLGASRADALLAAC